MILKFLAYCQSPNGGFCGGHYQLPHLASTYAAMLSLVELGTIESYTTINRKLMYKFLLGLRNPVKKGSFHMHENGEEDMRGVYIAVILADLLNFEKDKLLEGVGDYISSCQTYEGGIASEPFGEAHGGYSFCGFAALCCLKETHKINLEKFIYWAVNRQMTVEGGFNGRTNKVVDNCYSFWQGALFKLINLATENQCHCNGKMFTCFFTKFFLNFCFFTNFFTMFFFFSFFFFYFSFFLFFFTFRFFTFLNNLFCLCFQALQPVAASTILFDLLSAQRESRWFD